MPASIYTSARDKLVKMMKIFCSIKCLIVVIILLFTVNNLSTSLIWTLPFPTVSAVYAQNSSCDSADSLEPSDGSSGGLIGFGQAIKNLFEKASNAIDCAQKSSQDNNITNQDQYYLQDWDGECKGSFSSCTSHYPSWCTISSTGQASVFKIACHRESAGIGSTDG